jgi:hypothetical protein
MPLFGLRNLPNLFSLLVWVRKVAVAVIDEKRKNEGEVWG